MNTIIIDNIVYHIHQIFNLYAASADGNVINIMEQEPHKGTKSNNGYMIFNVRKDSQSKLKSYLVHRFVWECINNLIPKGLRIHHINYNTEDNRLCNLMLILIKHSMPINDTWVRKRFKCLDCNKVYKKRHKHIHEENCCKSKSTENWTLLDFEDSSEFDNDCDAIRRYHERQIEMKIKNPPPIPPYLPDLKLPEMSMMRNPFTDQCEALLVGK